MRPGWVALIGLATAAYGLGRAIGWEWGAVLLGLGFYLDAMMGYRDRHGRDQ